MSAEVLAKKEERKSFWIYIEQYFEAILYVKAEEL
jgi:hypothetical protein